MLTRKQQELLLFIQDCLARNGVSPSFEEMKQALQLKSKSGIHRLLGGLEARGFLRRLPNRARALEVLRPADYAAAPEARNPASGFTTLPFFGRIAAGMAIEALANSSGQRLAIPTHMLGSGVHYVLEVVGDSMVEAGIHQGDHLIIQQCCRVENGSIAVALIDSHEVTLKSVYHHGATITLVPANRHYQAQTYAADRVQVQGKLAGLLRRYTKGL